MNILEQQVSNRRRTWLVILLFVGFLLFLGYGIDRFYLGLQGAPPIGALAGLGLGSASALVSYFKGDLAVLRASGAVPIAESLKAAEGGGPTLQLHQLQNVVDEMAIASGLPRPAVWVVPDTDPNAFATGRDPAHATIAVTQGLLDLLSRDELQAVVAHEMSHVRNFDIRLMTIIAALVGAVALLSDWAVRGMRLSGRGGRGRGGSRKSGGGGGLGIVVLAVWILAAILAPIIGQLLAMAVSRRREYLADASGAELTRNPVALASALGKIEAAELPTRSIHRGSAHLCIADPLGRERRLKEGFWAELFASHPPMARRIAALRAMAYERAG
jgi:heat shock protein HtpX